MSAFATLLVAVPVEPSPDEARRLAVEELAKREYAAQRPSILNRILDWILGKLDQLGGGLPSGGTGTASAIIVGVVLVLVVVAVVVAGRVLRRPRQAEDEPVFGSGAASTARSHRQSADEAAERGDWRTAVVERFRAVVRELEDRAVLVPQPGRTADEAAADAALLLPDLGEALRAAARSFDDVRYGDRPADEAADAALRRLDEQVRTAKVRPAGTAAAVPAGFAPPGGGA